MSLNGKLVGVPLAQLGSRVSLKCQRRQHPDLRGLSAGRQACEAHCYMLTSTIAMAAICTCHCVPSLSKKVSFNQNESVSPLLE